VCKFCNNDILGQVENNEALLKEIIAYEGFPIEYEKCRYDPNRLMISSWVKDYDARPFFEIWFGETLKSVNV